MNATLVIGNKNYSSWSLRGWLLLKKLNYEFEEIVVPLYQGNFHQQLRQYSERAQVPVLIDNGVTVWDSMAIAEYLAENNPTLWPQDRSLRAQARSICAEMHSGFEALRGALPMNCRAQHRKAERSEALTTEIARIDSIWSQCRTQVAASHCDSGPWLYGSFTIADAMFAPVASRFRTYDIDDISPLSQAWVDTVLNDLHLREWYDAAARESWTIDASEVG